MRNRTWPSVVAIVAVTPQLAHTADAPATSERALEEVVVTAQKRAQSLQDVPISVVVTSGDALEKQNLSRLEDLAIQMPNVRVSRGTLSDQLTIRGVGSGSNGGFEQSVGTFVDGVYHGRGHFSQSAFVDVERVEVLRGPQSIYFGNNAIGGAFSVTTRKPGASWESSARASYEVEARETTLEMATGGPVSDTLGLRVAARYSDMDGYLKNLGSKQRNPGVEDKFIRATLLWQPDDLWTTTFKAEYGKQDSVGPVPTQMTDCPPAAPFTAPAGSCVIALAAGVETVLDDRRTSGPGEYGFLETKEFLLNFERQGDGLGFSSTLAYTEYDYMVTGDTDGTTADFFAFSAPETYEQSSLEFRFTSPERSRLGYIFGVYGLRGTLRTDTVNALFLNTTRAVTAVPALAPYTPLGRLATLDQDEESFSAFGALTWPFTDKFSGTLGARWTQSKKDAVQSSTAVMVTSPAGDKYVELPPELQAAAGPFVSGVLHSTRASRTDDDFIPSINLQYKQSRDVSFYANYSQGFKAGGFDSTEASGIPDRLQFAPESVEAYEVGAKTLWLDRALSVNLAVFHSDYTDLQQAVAQFNATSAFIVVTNVGALQSRGVELDADWRINSMWRVGLNVALLDAEYQNYQNAGCTVVQTRLAPAGTLCTQDLSGNPPPFAADYSGSARVGFRMPVGNSLEVSSDAVWSFSDAYHVISFEDPALEQGAWNKLDLRVGLGRADGAWEVALVGKNLADELTTSLANNAVATAGTYWRVAERGRSLAIQAHVRFE